MISNFKKKHYFFFSRTVDNLCSDKRRVHEFADDLPGEHDSEPGQAQQVDPQPHGQQDALQGRTQIAPGG
jgi:hypothetical protein